MLSSISTFSLLVSTLITSSSASSINLNPSRRQDVNLLDINTYLANGVANGTAPPGQRPQDSSGQFISVTPANGTDSFSQLSYCPTIFVTGAAVNGSFTPGGGWEGLPQVTYFDLKRDVKVGDATMPYYEEYGKDNTMIKRVIMIMPGQPRDSWKYAQLVRNSLLCAAANDRTIDLATILIVAPQFLALEDKAKGSGVDSDLAWEGSSWSGIADSRSPDGTRYSMMEALDGMVEHYFDTANYPALNSVYLAGHSLGATTVQRYNVLRKPTPNDPNVHSWVGNPGAYVWPVSSRPNMTGVDSGCLDYDSWAYGLNLTGPLPSYRKDDLLANKTNVLNQYFNRTVVHSLGLLDDGSGTNQCAAFFQGASHLERGQNFFKALQTLPNGQPSSFSVDFVNTSHIDYQMLADPSTQNYFFKQNIDVKNPQLVISNTSSNESSTNGTGSSNGSGSTSDNNASGSGSNGQSGDSSDAMKILSSRNLIFGTALISFGSFLLI